MAFNLARKLIAAHLVDGAMEVGADVAITVDQVLVNDGSGPLVMLELEALGLDRVRVDLAAAYMDHLLVQQDHRNADDHLFMESAARRFGLWYGRPGCGVAHPVHQEHFGVPGTTLIGGDSHTPAAGAIGQLAIGAGGITIALALAGHPFRLRMPAIWGVELVGELPPWVSAKDVILELLRRHGVDGGRGRIVEYHGPGLAGLSTMDRHVIANMGTELGALTSVFPSDEEVRRFLERQGRPGDWQPLAADPGATYDVTERIDLGDLEPLVAMPSSPGNVVPVRKVAGRPIQQAYVGSSANPGFRDAAVVARTVAGRTIAPGVSLDVNPASRRALTALIEEGDLLRLVRAGARIHQTGCNGCIGMGQAPASEVLSLRTVPRNFPGRSGTREDAVALVSPETAAASALRGVITDPRTLGFPPPEVGEPERYHGDEGLLDPPAPAREAVVTPLRKGPSISSLPAFPPLPDRLDVPVVIKVGDDVSTDEILPGGTRAMPLWSNVPAMADFCFDPVDPSYPARAKDAREQGGHAIVGGRNYGQGSSREHAALAPRFLGLRVVVAGSIARIHWENLVAFGVLPLVADDGVLAGIAVGDRLVLQGLGDLRQGAPVAGRLEPGGRAVTLRHDLNDRQIATLRAGGVLAELRGQQPAAAG